MQISPASHVGFTVLVVWPTLELIELGKKQVEFAVPVTAVGKAASVLVIEAFQARKTQVSRCVLMIERIDKKVWRIL
jgi:hypothetical protein